MDIGKAELIFGSCLVNPRQGTKPKCPTAGLFTTVDITSKLWAITGIDITHIDKEMNKFILLQVFAVQSTIYFMLIILHASPTSSISVSGLPTKVS